MRASRVLDLRLVALLASMLASAAPLRSASASQGPRACLLIDGERALQRGPSAFECRKTLELRALRQEHVAFQLVVEAGDEPLDELTIDIAPEHAASEALRFDLFLEHFVDVPRRSRTYDTLESLAFTPAAHPGDEGMIGLVPDALVPIARAPEWLPYPFSARPSERAALYVEAFVPAGAAAGANVYTVRLLRAGVAIATLPVSIDIAPIDMPYQALPAFAFFERETLERRFVDVDRVEKDLVRMLHAHHLDSVTHVLGPRDLERLRGSLDGSWFRDDRDDSGDGYRGPGRGIGATLLPLGMYGMFREPSAATVPVLLNLVERTPPSVRDVFVYAIDERCDSPRGGDWRALLRASSAPRRLRVGHTCWEPPAGQDVDIVMMPAQTFDPELAEEGRSLGKQVWIYNGALPYAGPPALDVPPTSLTLNGWIGGSFDVGRWFYWETIFWNDGNRGGHGPADVFATAETFHNADGDTSLYDGLLLFPGRMPAPFAAHDMAWDGVMPSLRLKALRRGLEDAGLLALAAQVDPDEAFEISRSVIGAALDEVNDRSVAQMEFRPVELAAARASLRRIIDRATVAPSSNPLRVARALDEIRSRRARVRRATGAGQEHAGSALPMLVLPGFLFGLGLALAYLLQRGRTR